MSDDLRLWLPPMLTLIGTLIVVVFTAWINNRAVFARLDGQEERFATLRQEIRANIAEAIAPINLALARIENKVDQLADLVSG